MGEVPLEWYKDELHIGYDREGRKVSKGPRRDKLDALLARNDGGAAWRTVYDEYNGEEITLSKEEMKMIQRIREGKFPHVEVSALCPGCRACPNSTGILFHRPHVAYGYPAENVYSTLETRVYDLPTTNAT